MATNSVQDAIAAALSGSGQTSQSASAVRTVETNTLKTTSKSGR